MRSQALARVARAPLTVPLRAVTHAPPYTAVHYVFRFHGAELAKRREPLRQAHERYLKEAAHVALAGALGSDPLQDEALVVVAGSPEQARVVAENDPYVRAGLVARVETKEWVLIHSTLPDLRVYESKEHVIPDE